MYEDKKDTNILLVLFTSIIYVFIAIFVIFFIGLSKVEAASYSWSQPTLMSFHTTRGDFTSLKSCTGVNECQYSNGDMVANFGSARYQFSRSLTDASQYAEQNTYSLSVRFRIVTLDEISKSNTNITMYYYPDNSNNYSLATCDGTQELTISKNTDYDYYVTYKCNEFTINRDISHMGLMIGGYPNSIYFVQMAQNLQLIGPGEASNDDIINNQNQNTQDIINNQNQNTQEIIDSVTNPDISGSNNTIGGFFGSFSDTDHGGLSGIITAPLIAFNQMLTGTCTDLSVEYEGSTTTLPCGTTFWNQISPIRDFLNITLGGLICYQIVRKLFLLIQKIKNPDDDRVEVMSL